MGILTEEYAIDSVFLEQPWKKLTYSEIQKKSGKKSKWYVNQALGRLVSWRVLNKPEKIGRSSVYGLRLDSTITQSYMGFLEEHRAWASKDIPLRIIDKLRDKIPTNFFVLLVTGSYVKGKQHKDSDLDVVVICDSDVDPRGIQAELQLEADLSIPKVHLYIFREKEVIEMLLSDKENYGKEFVRYHRIFYGGAAYFSILEEVVNHGFKG